MLIKFDKALLRMKIILEATTYVPSMYNYLQVVVWSKDNPRMSYIDNISWYIYTKIPRLSVFILHFFLVCTDCPLHILWQPCCVFYYFVFPLFRLYNPIYLYCDHTLLFKITHALLLDISYLCSW